MKYRQTLRQHTCEFDALDVLLSHTTPLRSGDALAGCAATRAAERVPGGDIVAVLPLTTSLNECVVPPRLLPAMVAARDEPRMVGV